ncbi:hypothetical protein Tco_0054458 [Tanacetum coccineum]
METMVETMEQCMRKTRADYGSGVARPKIKDNDNFELKGQFLKELRTNTFSGSDHEDANEHIEKVLEIVDLFYIPNITIDQVMLRAFPMSLTGTTSRWLRNEPTGSITTWDEQDENLYQALERFKELSMKCHQYYLTEMQEVILFYTGLGITTRQILDSRGAIPSKTAVDAKVAIQEMAEYSQKWHNGTSRSRSTKTSDGLVAIQAQLNNLGREIKKVNEKVYEGDIEQQLQDSIKVKNANPLYQEQRQSMKDTLNKFMSESAKRHKENSNLIKRIRASTDADIRNQGASIKTLEIQIGQMNMTEDIKVPFILEKPFLPNARAKIDVYKRKITLRVGEERIIFTCVKPASSLIKRVCMLSLRERMELDLEARLIGETLVLNRSLDPFFEDYIELNNLNEPFELRRNQGDDLMPTIEEGGVIEEFKTRDDELDTRISDYPSYCDYDKKIHIDCTHNLKFSCMLGFEFTHANFFPLLYVNVMSKKFHNSIMKDKMMYKGNNVIGALMNAPIFVGTFFVMTDAVLENMDAYRNEGMGDVIFGEPFLREVGIKTRWFKGMITIYNGNNEVTYQMVRSHPRLISDLNEFWIGLEVEFKGSFRSVDGFVSIPDDGFMAVLQKLVDSRTSFGKQVKLQVAAKSLVLLILVDFLLDHLLYTIIIANLPPPDHVADLPEDESVQPEPAPIILYHAPAQPEGYVDDDDMEEDEEEDPDEDPKEERIEQVDDDEELEEDEVVDDDDEEMEMDENDGNNGGNNDEDDAKLINAYKEYLLLFSSVVIIMLERVYLLELFLQVTARYKTEKRMAKKFKEDEFRMNRHEYDISTLDMAVRENRSDHSKMMKFVEGLSRKFNEFKEQSCRAEHLSHWEA